MKIGILTFQNAHNYGALLQAYALKTYLKNNGYNVEIINYANEEIESNYLRKLKNKIKIGGLRTAKKWFLTQCSIIYGKKDYETKWLKFNEFIKTNITNGEKIYKKSEIDFMKYDYLICGSDQIWNPYLTNGFDDVYFANVKTKAIKIAYAGSLGMVKLNDKEKERKFFELIKNFDYLSVREEALKKYIINNSDINVNTVLDPTLLIEKDEYKQFVKEVPYKNYILQYTLVDNPKLDLIVKKLAKLKNLDIIELRYSKNIFRRNGKQIASAGIEDFLSLINNAEYVITNSFHGTIFSILFEKNFYTLKINGVNSRIENILEITNLKNRCIESFEYINLEEKIDFRSAKAKIAEAKIDSENFLKNSLENCRGGK